MRAIRPCPPHLLSVLPALACTLASTLGSHPEAGAQITTFGKNKVQYAQFEWQVMKSDHFDLHFYPEERDLAEVALAMAESSYAVLAVRFRHEIGEPVPLVVFSAHAHFEQTNIIPQFLPEGVGGFTDFMRSRVALPFSGSYADFQRVLQHELVHAFQLSALDRTYRLHPRASYLVPPLWFMEGLAEYWSRSWDADGDMILADLIIQGELPDIPELWRLGAAFPVYKVGQSLVAFIAETCGDDKLALVYELIWTAASFEQLLEELCGIPVEDLNRRWKEQLRRRYYPTVKARRALGEFSEAVTEGGVDLKPVALPDEQGRFLYLSSHRGYSGIYAAQVDKDGGKEYLRGGRSSDLESFHIFGSRMDVSSDGRLAFACRSGGRDALYVYDLDTRRREASRTFDGLIALSSPTWSPDGRRVIFSALTEDGFSDLFLWDLDRDELGRLTRDRFLDEDPDWSPDGRWVVFSSDRTGYGIGGATNLFLLDLDDHRILYLTAGDWKDRSPRWNPAGERVVFSSDRDGRSDLYVVDREGTGAQLTRVQTQAIDPEWLPGAGWLFCGFEESQYHVYHMAEAPDSSQSVVLDLPPEERTWTWPAARLGGEIEVRPYRPNFSLEIAQGGVVFGPYQTLGHGLQAALADLMGDRLLFFQLTNTAKTSADFLSRFNIGLAYVNLWGRTNWGLSAFHTTGDFLDELGTPFYKRETGAGFLLSFPFSMFNRLESGITAMYGERENFGSGRSHGFMVANYLALVHDTSLWLPTGPIDGARYRLAGGFTMNARVVEAETGFLLADLRRYFRLSLRTALAFRTVGRIAVGKNPERSVLGGPFTLRGYDWWAVYGTRSILLNGEVRFPFLEGFVLDFPLGGLQFPGVQGVAFVDAGNAWEKGESVPRLVGSVGLGLRMALGGFMVLRLDFAHKTDFHTVSERTETQFFIGWNY